MINVTILKNSNDVYKGFIFKGHAGYATAGKDIVCSAVSILVINTINSIEAFTDDSFTLDSDEDSGYIKLIFENNISIESNILLNSLVLGITSVRDNGNKKYINIVFKEV